MSKFDIKQIENITSEDLIKNGNKIFSEVVIDLEDDLNLKSVFPNIRIEYIDDIELNNKHLSNPLLIGVEIEKRDYLRIIKIYDRYKEYIPIIILREAYFCFIPEELHGSNIIQIVINQTVKFGLKELNMIDKWWKQIESYTVKLESVKAEITRFPGLLRLQGGEKLPAVRKFLFEFIRKNFLVILNLNPGEFYDQIFKEYIYRVHSTLKNEEIIEALIAIMVIFYEVKSYRALLDYKKFFSDFKKSGKLNVNQGLQKFEKNLKWIANNLWVAPSYQINWNAINVETFSVRLCFHPFLKATQVYKVLEHLPFYIFSRSSNNNFSIECYGYFLFPSSYLSDLKRFLNNMKDAGYLIKVDLLHYDSLRNKINFNYFKDFYKTGRIVNPKHVQFNRDYIVGYQLDYIKSENVKDLSLIDWLTLNRIRYWSITGFGFERRSSTLRQLKIDAEEEINSQSALIDSFERNLSRIYENPALQGQIIKIIEKNNRGGFFFIDELLTNIFKSLKINDTFLAINTDITATYKYKSILENDFISKTIEDNLILRDIYSKDIVFQSLMKPYFSNKKKFLDSLEDYKALTQIFKTFKTLMIFNLSDIKRIFNNPEMAKTIINKKRVKLENSYKDINIDKMRSSDLDEIIDSFLEYPPIAEPAVVNTITVSSFSTLNYIFLCRNTKKEFNDSLKAIEFSPRILSFPGQEILTNKDLNSLEIFFPNMTSDEKFHFCSLFFDLIKSDFTQTRYLHDGIYQAYGVIDYYDFEKKKFFYTSNYLNQYFLYAKRIFDDSNLRSFSETSIKLKPVIWKKNINSFSELINKINMRKSKEKSDFNIRRLNNLMTFHNNLNDILSDNERMRLIRREPFFKKYIKAIKFIPNYQSFGLSKYYLYIKPIDLDDIDFKGLLLNNFQSIKHSAVVKEVNSFLIKYLFPYRSENDKYLNWLLKSKKNISEYCLFSIKKTHQLFHVDYNIYSAGWDISANRFKAYAQKILFHKDFKITIPSARSFNVGDNTDFDFLGPKTEEFQSLSEIYGCNSKDRKVVLGSNRSTEINQTLNLLAKSLIFPYIQLKSLGLIEKVYIILPNVESRHILSIIKIFSYFNFGFISEIEGTFFVHELEDKTKFENGIFIKLFLPDCDISDFQPVFRKIFSFLNIERYLILTDYVKASNLLQHVFGDFDFSEKYNPLKNLEWNSDDKIWKNHRILSKDFEMKYPKLIVNEKETET